MSFEFGLHFAEVGFVSDIFYPRLRIVTLKNLDAEDLSGSDIGFNIVKVKKISQAWEPATNPTKRLDLVYGTDCDYTTSNMNALPPKHIKQCARLLFPQIHLSC